MPMNAITETIFYNMRLIIDTNLYNADAEYRTWEVSKINRISPYGICSVTFYQDKINLHTDYIEKDEKGNIVGKWANYWVTNLEPEQVETDDSLLISTTAQITSSIADKIKVGGSRVFTVTFYEDDEPVNFIPGEWSFFIGNEDASDVLSLSYPAENKVRAKFTGGDMYVGEILSVRYKAENGVTAAKDVAIVAL